MSTRDEHQPHQHGSLEGKTTGKSTEKTSSGPCVRAAAELREEAVSISATISIMSVHDLSPAPSHHRVNGTIIGMSHL